MLEETDRELERERDGDGVFQAGHSGSHVVKQRDKKTFKRSIVGLWKKHVDDSGVAVRPMND